MSKASGNAQIHGTLFIKWVQLAEELDEGPKKVFWGLVPPPPFTDKICKVVFNSFYKYNPQKCFFVAITQGNEDQMVEMYFSNSGKLYFSRSLLYLLMKYHWFLLLSHFHVFGSLSLSQLSPSLSTQMIPTLYTLSVGSSLATTFPSLATTSPIPPIPPLVSQAGRPRCLQILLRDGFSHLFVVWHPVTPFVAACDALWRPF